MMTAQNAKIWGFVGCSGAGKTTLIEGLIGVLRAQNLRVSVIKHAHHGFDIDRPGKDSFRHREAGANEVMLVSPQRWVLMHENQQNMPEPSVYDQLQRLSPCDWVLVEGFRETPIPKIEIWRETQRDATQSLRCHSDQNIVAVATDSPNHPHLTALPVPCLDLNNIDHIAEFIVDYFGH
jgi:molybdopterin-guanine dinucleotide biosynthesis adapter protein